MAGAALHPFLRREATGKAGDGGALQRLLQRHRRQQTGKALREHGFAGARWADEQHSVHAGGCDFHRALGGALAFHVGEVRAVLGRRDFARAHALQARRVAIARCLCIGWQKVLHHVEQMFGAVDLCIGNERGFFGAGRGKHLFEIGRVLGLRADRQTRGERAAHRTQRSRERQLARELVARKAAAVDLPAGREDAHGDRQVETPGILGQIGGRKVHDDLLVGRKLQSRVLQRRAHPLARLLDFDVRQAHQREAGKPVGQMHLHGDRHGLQTREGAALH